MDTLPKMETTEGVFAIAHAHGFAPTPKQWKDWRRAGLLPKASKRHGFGRNVGGSVVFYPPGTGELLAAAGRHSKPKKPLPQLAFLVWWDGYDLLDVALVRAALSQTIDEWERLAAPWRNLDTVPESEWAELDRKLGARLPSSLRFVMKRIGMGPFRYLLGTLLNIAAGGFDGFRPYASADGDDAQGDMKAALGLRQASWVSDNLEAQLSDLSALIEPVTLRKLLHEATDRDLNQTRDEIRDLVRLIGDVQYLASQLGGTGELEPFAHLDGESITAGILAGCTLFWLSASRQPALRRNYRQLWPAMETVSECRRLFDTVSPDKKRLPRRLEPSGSMTRRESPPACTASLSPSPPPNLDTVSSA